MTVLQHILDEGRLREAIARLARHLRPGGRLVVLEAAPTRRETSCDTRVFQARSEQYYRTRFAEAGLAVRALRGVDPAPWKTRFLPRYAEVAARAARARARRDHGGLHSFRSARLAVPRELVLAQGVRPRTQMGKIMSTATLDNGTALLALERKRVLDFVWIVTLAVEACALAMLGWMGVAERGIAAVGRSVLVYGAIFVLVADFCYRMKTPRAVHCRSAPISARGSYSLSTSGRSREASRTPTGWRSSRLPLLVSGMVGIAWLPRASAALALAGIWGVAYQ